jgi:3-deoxy-D-arabino-heptulosonate 7-phosphate (DAHP) synthase class II
MPRNWTKTSWQSHEAAQQPQWPDSAALDQALKQIETIRELISIK